MKVLPQLMRNIVRRRIKRGKGVKKAFE